MAKMEQVPQQIENTPQTDSNMIDKKKIVWGIIIFLLIVAATVFCIFELFKAGPDTTSQVRDIFIIVLALESFIIGVALVILVIQLASLTNMLQNEIKPILENTRRTVLTLKGTSAFLSKHAIQPVLRVSSLAAGLRKLVQIIGIIRK